MSTSQPDGHGAIPLLQWPEGDRHAYELACLPGSPFDEGGQAAKWRPATHKALMGTYARWLGFLVGEDCDLAMESPPDRVTRERMDRYRRFLIKRCASETVSSYLGQLHMMLRDVWPAYDWAWLCDMQARQHRMAEPSRHKEIRVVAQQDLLQLGLDLMRRATLMPIWDGMPAGPHHPALIFRDGFMIALLALRPLRQRNFLGLQLGRHLREEDDTWEITIPATETKNHSRLVQPFPQMLVSALKAYLTIYRPHLLGLRGPAHPNHRVVPAGAHLWVTRCGSAMTPGALQKALQRHTTKRFGHVVNCHLFRDCVATSIANEDPEHFSVAACLLGHHSVQTTHANYVAADRRAALRCSQTIVVSRRKAAKRKPPCIRGKRS